MVMWGAISIAFRWSPFYFRLDCACSQDGVYIDKLPARFGLVYWGLTPQQQPGSYQGGEMMMMKSVPARCCMII